MTSALWIPRASITRTICSREVENRSLHCSSRSSRQVTDVVAGRNLLLERIAVLHILDASEPSQHLRRNSGAETKRVIKKERNAPDLLLLTVTGGNRGPCQPALAPTCAGDAQLGTRFADSSRAGYLQASSI